MNRDATPPNPLRASRLLGLLALLWAAMPGCSDPLLAPTDERTQFDRYDRVRNKYAQQYIEDEYGRREPNLRARLAPKN